MPQDTQAHPVSDRFDAAFNTPGAEELLALRDSIMTNAKRSVDPAGTGFSPTMSFEGGFTNDELLTNWWEWAERVFSSISLQISWAMIAVGGAVSSAIMFGTERGAHLATPTLVVAAVFAAGVGLSAIIGVARGR